MHFVSPQIQLEQKDGRTAAFLRCPVSGFMGQIAEIVLADGEVAGFTDHPVRDGGEARANGSLRSEF